ncbi:phosphoglycerate mutase-like protein, partial [Tilletiaria anomala UBC 951]
LSLQQVHYIVRHGERTPVRARLAQSNPPIPTRWNLCHEANRFRAAVLRNQDGDAISATTRAVEVMDERGRPKDVHNGDCLYGELTDLGRSSTFAVGQRLRKLYADQLGFLPDLNKLSAEDTDSFYFRSTNMPRTVESLQQIVAGLLSRPDRDPSAAPPASGDLAESPKGGFAPQLLVRDMSVEDLLPNTVACGTLRHLDQFFSSYAARLWNPHLAKYDSVIAPHNDGHAVRVDSHPRLNGILDTVNAAVAHGITVPACFRDSAHAPTSLLREMERAVVAEWFIAYLAPDPHKRAKFRRLAMGPFLNSVADRLEAKADSGVSQGGKQGEKLKLGLYAAHDTSLAGMLCTLDAFRDRWPAFTASLGIELFKDERPHVHQHRFARWGSMLGLGTPARAPHYVRLRFGDETLRLPGCAAPGKHLASLAAGSPSTSSSQGQGHPEFCTLEAFLELTRALRHPDGLSYSQEC